MHPCRRRPDRRRRPPLPRPAPGAGRRRRARTPGQARDTASATERADAPDPSRNRRSGAGPPVTTSRALNAAQVLVLKPAVPDGRRSTESTTPVIAALGASRSQERADLLLPRAEDHARDPNLGRPSARRASARRAWLPAAVIPRSAMALGSRAPRTTSWSRRPNGGHGDRPALPPTAVDCPRLRPRQNVAPRNHDVTGDPLTIDDPAAPGEPMAGRG